MKKNNSLIKSIIKKTALIIAVLITSFINSKAQTYCIPTSSSITGYGITNVIMGSLSNLNLSTLSYQDFTSTAPIPTIVAGTNQPIAVTYQTSYPYATQVFIDFNHDGDFFDTDETQFIGSSNYKSVCTVFNTITIPAGATLGNTRMRIMGQYIDYDMGAYMFETNGYPCSYLTPGNAEDYTINIVATNACNGSPLPGNTLATVSSACSAVNFTLSLQNSMIGTGNTYQWQSSNDSLFTAPINLGTNFFQTTSQTTAKYFRCLVTCSTGSSTGISNKLYVGMNAPTNCYCDNYPNTMDVYGITDVIIGTLSNQNYSSIRYQDFTSTATIPNLNAGSIIPITVSLHLEQNTHCKVYFDFNHDGDFFDLNEEQIIGSSPDIGPSITFNTSVSIPSSALSGNTRMRIVCFGGGAVNTALTYITPCNMINYSNVEDYTVNIVGGLLYPLPVIWNNFSAQLIENNEVEIKWNTESEINNDYFEVEHSQNGNNFSSIYKVEGNKNNSTLNSYLFLDKNANVGNNYYRIKQTDIDGKTSYSIIENVIIATQNFNANVFPMPFKNDLQVSISLPSNSNVEYAINDLSGKEIISNKIVAMKGNNIIHINTETLANGFYFLKLKSNQTSLVKRIIKN